MQKLNLLWLLLLLTTCNKPENKSEFKSDGFWKGGIASGLLYWDETLLQYDTNPDWKGPVKKVHQKLYGARMDGDKIIKTKDLEVNSSIDNNIIYHFDTLGRVTFIDAYYHLASPKNSSRERLAYYHDGKLLSERSFDKDYSHLSFFIYDERGRLNKKIQIHSQEINQPDWTIYENYLYNDTLNTITMELVADHGLLKLVIFSLDVNGNISKMETKREGMESPSFSTFKFDEKGRKLEEISGRRKNNFYYDENDFLVKFATSDGDLPEVSEFRYSLDQHGNWIRNIEYVRGIPVKITEREIEYY
ncbi:MAG TPA: hypothetical protein VK916_03350 [Gillisia sp.]|nr:hypothetical protein [Gillisia sp.]